ncbi:DUF6894 family protein [Methylobacterium sp. E-065]|uniref:DUF6894 family protein n=1 Tax=Methylobacterium sp. E-065 TaxID=2836583 RepID=UPI00391AD86E
MPRYYFDVSDGDRLSRDTIGTDCEDTASVCSITAQSLSEIGRDSLFRGSAQQSIMAIVRDEQNITVCTAMLSFSVLWFGSDIPAEEDDII